jgi:exonuclease III
VALLINRDLNEFSIIKEYKNTDENFHLISCKINGFNYCLGAIYGPNNTSHAFYSELTDVLTDVNAAGIVNIIIGGDWNTTWDRRPVNSNIDTFCMSGLPNAKNSELLERLCMRFSLTDPFRALYPDKRDFTYAPFGDVRLNRSRLDFFIVSNNILDQVNDCVISNAPRCKLFDHKSVRLELFRPPILKAQKNIISNAFLKDKSMRFAVELAARKAHVLSIDRVGVNAAQLVTDELEKINVCLTLLKTLITAMDRKCNYGATDAELLHLAAIERSIELSLEDMLPIADLEMVNKRCDSKTFFECLV